PVPGGRLDHARLYGLDGRRGTKRPTRLGLHHGLPGRTGALAPRSTGPQRPIGVLLEFVRRHHRRCWLNVTEFFWEGQPCQPKAPISRSPAWVCITSPSKPTTAKPPCACTATYSA